ncbi:MAG: PD40 domain-containing protein [Chloroflexi bacterium]|nr:PD40 domain-containing protein [Chloroflexota bacterium]
MKRIVFLALLSLLLSLFIACRGTLEVGVEKTPSPRLESALGQLAYVQGGDIWVRDLRDFPYNEPRRLTTDGRNASPRWSPSGQWLSFHKEQALWMMRADGSGAWSLVAPKYPIEAAWSPIEDRLAYVTAQGGLLIVKADGTAQIPLIPDATPGQPGGVERFAWRPDGQWLVCQMVQWADLSEEKPPIRQVLRIVRADGSESADLYAETDPMATSMQLAGWSGDGMYILFWRGPASASLQADGVPLMSILASGGNPQAIAAEPVLMYADFVTPQPSTSRLAVVLGSGRESWAQKRLVFVDADAQSPTSLDGGQAIAAPAWSPDGQQIAYVGIAAREGVAGGEGAKAALNERHIWVVGADGTGQRQLTNDPQYRDERRACRSCWLG